MPGGSEKIAVLMFASGRYQYPGWRHGLFTNNIQALMLHEAPIEQPDQYKKFVALLFQFCLMCLEQFL